jgi:uncharacterized membrane protein
MRHAESANRFGEPNVIGAVSQPQVFRLAARTGSAASRPGPSSPYGKEIHVKTSQLLVASAVAAALAMPIASQAGPAPKPKFESEKCYGVVKAGKNDCQTANSSCAGTSKRDNQGDAWIYMPAGSCEKLVGGSKDPKRA